MSQKKKNTFGSPQYETLSSKNATASERRFSFRISRRFIGRPIVALMVLWVVVVTALFLVPLLSNRYVLPNSAFDQTAEAKILEDYYALPNIDDRRRIFAGAEEPPQGAADLGIFIQNELENLTGEYGVYVKNLKTGEKVLINPDKSFTAASLAKLFVVGAYYREVEHDVEVSNAPIVLRESDRIEGSGSLVGDITGTTYYPYTLIEKMLKESDNTAFAMMTRYVGFNAIRSFIDDVGLSSTDFANNDTTPRDVGAFFERLYDNSILSVPFRDEFISLMQDTIFEDRIPFYLPDEATVSHKVGTWSGVYNDAGIVFSPHGDYVIVVMSENANYEESVNAIRMVSKIIYTYFAKKV